jgi:formylglycine-generating enzyme required for sulfatase activity
MTVVIGASALGLVAQKPDRTLRPQQATVQVAAQEARVALVIGNGAYSEAPLRNPVNDAQSMKAALESCKFQVTLLTDASKRQMEDAIRAFGDTIRGGAVGLFYFAGHGVQVKSVNYLVPIGARMDREDEVAYQAVEAGLVLDKMDAAKNQLNILILDACRNNPFARSWRGAGDKGLAQVKAPTGSLIAYATAPGSTAADGTGDHGLYTEALLAQLKEPGLELEKVFKRVREKVLDGSHRQQTPWESNSTVGDFYFRPLSTHITGPTEAQVEATYWEGIQGSRDPKDFESFLSRFPGGRFAELAKVKLANQRRASENIVVSNLAEPWKALQRDELETKQEYAQRVVALGPVKVGTGMVNVHNYNVDSGRLVLPIQADAWAKPYVKAGRLVLELDRDQMRALVKAGDTAALVARFRVRDGQPVPGELMVSTKIGVLAPAGQTPPTRNAQGLPEVMVELGGPQLALVQIPSGSFAMGAIATDSDKQINNWLSEMRPVHQVTISHEYWMGKFPVTQGQWQVVMGNNPSKFKNAGADAPVELVSWEHAQQFLTSLNGMQSEWTFRLPTEAEWEHACRAGTTTDTYAGNLDIRGENNSPTLDAIAWYAGNSGVSYEGGSDSKGWRETQYTHTRAGTHPVGQKQPNAFGLYDMLGNVRQWCQDWYGDYTTALTTDPQGPSSGQNRVHRGGSYLSSATCVRSAFRNYDVPHTPVNSVGFRVCAVARTQ